MARAKIPLRKKLTVKRSHRTVWDQKDYETFIPCAAARLVRNDLAPAGHKMSIRQLMDEAQVNAGFAGNKLKNVPTLAWFPLWVKNGIEAERKKLKAMDVPAPTPAPAPAEEVVVKPSYNPTREELWQETLDRIEARQHSQQRQLDAIAQLFMSVLTVKEGTPVQELIKEVSVMEAMNSLEKVKVTILGIDPGHEFFLKQFTKDFDLRVFEVGKGFNALKNGGIGKPDIVIVARDIGANGIRTVKDITGKDPLIASGISSVKRLLTEVMQNGKLIGDVRMPVSAHRANGNGQAHASH